MPGTFCWPELATTDQQGASPSIAPSFGWEVDEQPIGPTETYSTFKMRGLEVGAAYSMRAEERQHGAATLGIVRGGGERRSVRHSSAVTWRESHGADPIKREIH